MFLGFNQLGVWVGRPSHIQASGGELSLLFFSTQFIEPIPDSRRRRNRWMLAVRGYVNFVTASSRPIHASNNGALKSGHVRQKRPQLTAVGPLSGILRLVFGGLLHDNRLG